MAHSQSDSVRAALAAVGWTSPVPVLHFDRFDEEAEQIVQYYWRTGKMFTVVVGGNA